MPGSAKILSFPISEKKDFFFKITEVLHACIKNSSNIEMSKKKKGNFLLLKTPISQIIFCVFSYKHFCHLLCDPENINPHFLHFV